MRVNKFRALPIEVEAVRFDDVSAGSVIATWCGGSNEASPEVVDIPASDGTLRANLGDWVIKGSTGEFSTCTPDVFAAMYELA